jgi:glycosyltransferase involved in cell wall biosynthesis
LNGGDVNKKEGKSLANLHIVFFMTRGMSLREWERNGSLEREIALYRELGRLIGGKISIVSYGGIEEQEYKALFPGLEVLSNRWGLPLWLYENLIPYLHGDVLCRGSFYKTNQIDGASVCMSAAQKYRKPFIARCGYLWSEIVQNNPAKRGQTDKVQRIENRIFKKAERVVVTTPRQLERVIKKYGVSIEKCRVIPNYVLTDLFTPASQSVTRNRICMVGRLDSEKNPLAVVDACEGLDVEIVMAGSGPLREEIIRRACTLRLKVELLGIVPNQKLPDVLRNSSIYAMVSPLEGHPKALLEAMACGLPVIGADSPGIREEIRDGETGVLCGSDSASIRLAIKRLMNDSKLRKKLGQGARTYILENYSLERIVENELRLYQTLLARKIG